MKKRKVYMKKLLKILVCPVLLLVALSACSSYAQYTFRNPKTNETDSCLYGGCTGQGCQVMEFKFNRCMDNLRARGYTEDVEK